jgi:haloalkane dehalogenase
LVRGLIIGNTWAWPHNHEPRIRAFSWIMGGRSAGRSRAGSTSCPDSSSPRGFARPIDPGVLNFYVAPWSDPMRHAPAAIAPRQLVAAAPYLANIEANLHTLADRPY